MDPISQLAQMFTEFPGIGTRQAKRFAYFLLKRDRQYADDLIALIKTMRANVRECPKCRRYHVPKTDTRICALCSDETRDRKTLVIVERDSDLESMERSGSYHGLYFVLGGTLPVLEKDASRAIRSKELHARVDELGKDGLREIILACSFTPESEHTSDHVRSMLGPLKERYGLRITTLGRGLSTGTELEYSDPDTLRYALEGRK